MTDDSFLTDVLRTAGWSADRTVATDSAATALARDGHAIWDALLAFLREFSGLTIRFMRNGREDSAWFDAERATAWADTTSVRAYEERLRTTLSPVGYAHHDHLLLLVARDGRFLGAYDDFLADLGRSPVELLRNLLNNTVTPIDAA
ncbi:MAG TPA: SUKH-3 domain-containing protein [Candidatus Angelobacter sp.]|jgi:hypothetical protein|nr:SUKH-3 domain-containing protein [Candidatus Angelobacter sp.]